MPGRSIDPQYEQTGPHAVEVELAVWRDPERQRSVAARVVQPVGVTSARSRVVLLPARLGEPRPCEALARHVASWGVQVLQLDAVTRQGRAPFANDRTLNDTWDQLAAMPEQVFDQIADVQFLIKALATTSSKSNLRALAPGGPVVLAGVGLGAATVLPLAGMSIAGAATTRLTLPNLHRLTLLAPRLPRWMLPPHRSDTGWLDQLAVPTCCVVDRAELDERPPNAAWVSRAISLAAGLSADVSAYPQHLERFETGALLAQLSSDDAKLPTSVVARQMSGLLCAWMLGAA